MTQDLKFINDLMSVGRHIVELNASNNAAVRSYVWGLDLSGSLDGAGGVGGLLWVTLNTGTVSGAHFCAYDGNGNVAVLVKAQDGTASANYEYGPFAEPIRVTGPAARVNPFRFSTKRTDDTTDLVLYEYRAYSPSLGRWLSRDPIEERGGLNLYATVKNALIVLYDADGRFVAWIHRQITHAAALNDGFSSDCARRIAEANVATDYVNAAGHVYHFTRHVFGNKSRAYQESSTLRDRLLSGSCELAARGLCNLALNRLGVGLHILQDEYSHVVNGDPVSFDPYNEYVLRWYPPWDDPNHLQHARDMDLNAAVQAYAATRNRLSGLAGCFWCCCKK